jgi:hypothetical protein
LLMLDSEAGMTLPYSSGHVDVVAGKLLAA